MLKTKKSLGPKKLLQINILALQFYVTTKSRESQLAVI